MICLAKEKGWVINDVKRGMTDSLLGIAIMGIVMLYLVARPELTGLRFIPTWMKVVLVLGCIVVILLAARTAWNLVG